VLKGEPPAENLPAEVEFLPGSQWSYSNLGYILIQFILEKVTERPLSELAEEIVFEPLGMTNSTLRYPLPEEWRSREIVPHDAEGSAHKPEMHPTAVAPGGLVTTPSDMALFTLELMKAWQGKSDLIINRETARAMLSTVMTLDPSPLGFPMGQALGAFIFSEGENMSFCHPGDNFPGASSWLMGYPALGHGVIIMTNGAKGNLLALEIISALEKEYGWPPFRM
jgi:CubicO group peptidase (beta-lactamase class C family)